MTKGADTSIHRDKFTVMFLCFFAQQGECFFVGLAGHPRVMRCAIPDYGEKRLLGGGLSLDELECLVDDYLGGVAGVFLDFSVATHDRVTIKKIGH